MMRAKKIAISVPAEVIEEVDRAAEERRLTRSAFITDVLRRVARAKRDAEITEKINALFTDPEIVAEQKKAARDFRAVSSRIGTEW
jgi:metal-responsive CopG/Arc/MetJ family transcriptional regulator